MAAAKKGTTQLGTMQTAHAHTHTLMDKINDSSQVRDCLTHTDVAKENKADSNQQIQHTDAAEESKADCSQENMGGLNTKRRHSQSYKTEADDQKQKTGAEAQSSDPWGEGKLKKEPECHMQLDKLFPNQNHTVLIDTNEFMAGRIVPHKGQHVWNSHFVKLPHNYPLQNGIESRWAVTEKALKERKLTRGASAKDVEVDFASNMIGGGVLNQGLVQEEIRFIQCPELIVARLFTEKLGDNECLKITGAQVYSNTTGYSDSFQCNSPHTDSTQRDEWKRRYCQIVAIDAIKFDDPRQQYSEKNIKRELLKAYVGFKGDPQIPTDYTPAIATGNWGCGAFKGDPMLKALIQMMAAAVAHRDLAYFTFGNKKQAEDLKRTYKLLKSHKVTVGKLYNLLLDYCKHHHHHHHHVKSVSDYISEKMGVHPSQL
ncbi:poly(ADP-ribose) glycohydrolase [Silurus meridionalis]|nr:poly(ADP-ribose) glycohydrolase [Silurus meridionalis]